MVCICGCDEDDHLYNLPSGPPSSNSFFEDFWKPTFVDVLTHRLLVVIGESEPSRRFLWRRSYGGEAQDTVHPFHKWARLPPAADHIQGFDKPLPRLPTPNFKEIMKEEQMVYEQLMQDWKRRSGDDERDESLDFMFPTGETIHTSSLRSQERLTDFSFLSDFTQPISDSLLGPATQAFSLKHAQANIASRGPPFHGQLDQPEKSSPREFFHHREPTDRASDDPMFSKGLNQSPAAEQAEAKDLDDRPKTQTDISSCFKPTGCLCGCGGNGTRCLRPNTPPSCNAFFENLWCPNPAYIRRTRLDEVASELEPSERTWWREEFDGCALDRVPLISEILNKAWEGESWSNILETSSPPFDDVSAIRNKAAFQPSRKFQSHQ